MKKLIYYSLFIGCLLISTKKNFANNSDTITTVKKVQEIMPTYPGGAVAMMKFISSNLKYPLVAKKNKLEGKVIVKFYIDIDGFVKEPFVLQDGVGGGAAEEAIRLVSSMPKWKPGTQGGKPVKVYYTLPIAFLLK